MAYMAEAIVGMMAGDEEALLDVLTFLREQPAIGTIKKTRCDFQAILSERERLSQEIHAVYARRNPTVPQAEVAEVKQKYGASFSTLTTPAGPWLPLSASESPSGGKGNPPKRP